MIKTIISSHSNAELATEGKLIGSSQRPHHFSLPLPLPNYVTGRPREFDEADVLDRSLRQFWEHGFEATTMRDLQNATQLSSQSIYNSFGGKRGLLIGAIDHYNYAYLSKLVALINDEEDPIEAVRIPIGYYRDKASDVPRPGCFLANALVECGQDVEVARRCKNGVRLLRDAIASRLEEASDRNFLTDTGPSGAIAASITNNLLGLATLSCGGVDRNETDEIFQGMMSFLKNVVKPDHW